MPSELCRFSMLLWLMKIAAGRKQSSQEGTKSTDWLLSSFILSRPSEKTTKIPGWLPIFLLGWHHLGTWSWWRHLFSCQLLSLCFSHTKRTMLPYSGFLNLFVVWNKRWRKGKALHLDGTAKSLPWRKKCGYNLWKILWTDWLHSDFSWLPSKNQIFLENAVFYIGR